MITRAWLTLFLAISLASGCMASRSLLAIDGPVELSGDSGLVVIETDSNSVIHRLTITGLGGIGKRFFLSDIEEGRTRHLIDLPEGRYRWSRIELPGPKYQGRTIPYVWDLPAEEEHWEFSVARGTVNYPGVLVLSRTLDDYLSAFTLNRSGELVEFLRRRASWTLETYPVTYSGRVRDDFLKVYSEAFRAQSRTEPDSNASPP